MRTNRILGFATHLKRQSPNPRAWTPTAPKTKITLQPWSGLRAASDIHLVDLKREIDPEVLISAASTGVSLWDGYIPDPVDPSKAGGQQGA